MKTAAFDPAHLRDSVFAVPPLARDSDGKPCATENKRMISHLESGGVRSILYGGNAVFYHISMSEYASVLAMLADSSGDDTVIVPSIGPAYGLAQDQIDVLRDFEFPTVMLLPSRDVIDQEGIATGVRRLADRLGKPIVLYLKFDEWLEPRLIEKLESDGAISWIKYAVVRDDPAVDDYLNRVIDIFPQTRIVSGIGEQPAIEHLRDFGITGFTSGCVCVAPDRSMEMMHAIHDGDFAKAEEIRKWFLPLEDLRNEINPIRVLHHAVDCAGISKTGPLLPFLSDLTSEHVAQIASAVNKLGYPA
ncbi:dihydrodipicolinate synthase family protein [Planctomycetes bacterium K23_9]|uniref:Putative 5-dehydro-4-deoxyglucarate dehydratase n=1 Tax=Stieleria marina TaxID=1930275 RepID=A0A517NTF1_9BACT|nr:putative 5-dehydro-4-deoxyglucarate dehydratase [Planctomycetes bacterium K23_9]